jgi:hypothetical protein
VRERIIERALAGDLSQPDVAGLRALSQPDVRSLRTAWWQRILDEPVTYELTRFALLRSLAFVYFFAFLSLALQLEPLLGSKGLLPIAPYLKELREQAGPGILWQVPSVFWLGASDRVLEIAAWSGVVLSAAAFAGVTNAVLQVALWVLYSSFVHTGQIFFGYGWEFQLLETGLLAVFLCPLRDVHPLPATRAPAVVIWLFRWIIFRVMLGSALIKLRGDPCWRDLSCLDYHFETQPNPNPLAWWFHQSPHAVHVAGVLFNYAVELVAPWFAFGTRRWRHPAGLLMLALQATLIVSGNLSFLNWLTIVPALACFDDSAFLRLVPSGLRSRLGDRVAGLPVSRGQSRTAKGFALVVAVLSVAPVVNLASCDQKMNDSFEPLAIVNTYGAFGSVDRERYELILEGTIGSGPDALWMEYELPCMPGDPARRPCLVSPYHYRLDWQMWFVGNGVARGARVEGEPWLVHFIWQLLEGEPTAKRLLARDPFPRAPPRWIRASLWRYHFSTTRAGGAWWTRERLGLVVSPQSLDSPGLRTYVSEHLWADAPEND